MEPVSPSQIQFACMVCRSRKVKCDKTPSGCTRCREVGVRCPGFSRHDTRVAREEIDNIYKHSGLERRRKGACETCRTSKAKCTQEKPTCRRCQLKRVTCVYSSLESGSQPETSATPSQNNSRIQGLHTVQDAAAQETTARSISADFLDNSTTHSPSQWLFQTRLPDNSGLKILANAYFRHINPLRILGFLHKPTFMRAIDLNTATEQFGEAIIYIVCALGARFLRQGPVSDGHKEDVPGRHWGCHAKKLVQQSACNPSLENLMSLVLYCEYGLRIGDNAFVYMLVGCCTRMTRLLRLDIEDKPVELQHSSSQIDWTRQEMRRRVVWSCYFLDSIVGSGVDANLSWATTVPTLPMPCSENDFQSQTESPPVYAQVNPWVHSMKPTHLRGNICRIIYIRTQILRYIRTSSSESAITPLPWEEGSKFLELLGFIDCWYKQLPESLIFKDINIYVHEDQHSLGAFFFLNLIYHACIFDLTRVTLAGYNFPLQATLYGAPDDFLDKHRYNAWYHASCVSNLLDAALKYGNGALDDHFTATAAFESTKVQVIYLTTVANGDSELYKEGIQNINTNLQALAAVHPYPDMPNVYLSALCPFLHRFGFSTIASQWEPFQNTSLRTQNQPTGSSEVVGPVESAYVNQIATFRLARREIAEETPRRDFTTMGNTSPSIHASSRLANTTNSLSRIGPGVSLSRPEPTSSLPAQESDRRGVVTPSYGELYTSAMPGSEPEISQLDQEQYLRMAEAIGDYMTWDASLSQFDFPAEGYFDMPGFL